ncbi:hypothetical protein LX64_05067 [Chitinophaga skermanii]|uniref:Uncharacterized protein n=1 Tax=Chitinophaga skermanii TaxID=331697 RepID=A0A327PZS1_9BACT|nr:hypothetical protein LX64_05067 [Chitinophaga skermanii]
MYYIFIQTIELFDELAVWLRSKFENQAEPMVVFQQASKRNSAALGGDYHLLEFKNAGMCLVKNEQIMLQPKYEAYPYYIMVKFEDYITPLEDMNIIKYIVTILKEMDVQPVLTTELGL